MNRSYVKAHIIPAVVSFVLATAALYFWLWPTYVAK